MKTYKRLLFVLTLSVLFIGCVTGGKVKGWLDDHPTEAAGYCADKFPPDTTARITYDSVDTKAYEKAYWNMAYYADSIFNRLEAERNAFRPTPSQPCPPPVNLDSMRREVDKEIKKRLIPCKDSIKVVETTVVDRAREKQLQGKLEEKDAVITIRDKRITNLEGKNKSLGKWPWLFWALVALIGVYTFLKLRFKLPF